MLDSLLEDRDSTGGTHFDGSAEVGSDDEAGASRNCVSKHELGHERENPSPLGLHLSSLISDP